MKMVNIFYAAMASISLFSLASSALAHGRWLVPSHSILSGEEAPYVTFDISISNDIFHPDWAMGGELPGGQKREVPQDNPRAKIISELMGSVRLELTSPSGKVDDALPLVNFHRKSVSVAQLKESGTYRASVTQNPIYFTFYTDKSGKQHREFGKPGEVKHFLPEGASEIRGKKLSNRISTFVSRNDIGHKAIEPAQQGLDVQFKTHPNELFVGETAELALFLDGKPVPQSVEIKITRGGTRFRNERKPIILATGKKGRFDLKWPDAGMYLLEAELELAGDEADIGRQTYALYITLEVNPE